MSDPLLKDGAGWPAVVLAGQRTEPSPLAAAAGVAADVLVPVAGRASVLRVIDALAAASRVRPRVLVGPAPTLLRAAPDLEVPSSPSRAAQRRRSRSSRRSFTHSPT